METAEGVKRLREIVLSYQSGRAVTVDLDVCRTLLMAVCELEEKSTALQMEQGRRHADCRFLESICVAALTDLKMVAMKHMLCDGCKYLQGDGKCDSPRENESNCWVWRGVCADNTEEAGREE